MLGRIHRQRLAELTSGVGTGLLGLGFGALLARPLAGLTVPILFAGAAMHAWGMFDSRRIEFAGGVARPWWSALLYWLCWAALLGLASILLLRALG